MKDPNSKFRGELLDSVAKRKGDIADAIGMPDQKDYETLLRIIQRYNQTHSGVLQHTINEARREFQAGVYGKRLLWDNNAITSKESNMIYAFELPVELYQAIEQVFPSMFKSKKHLTWFKKNFVKLTIAGKV